MNDITDVSLDFTKVAEQDKPVPPGSYSVLVKEFKITPETAQERANLPQGKYAYFKVRAEINDGPCAGRALFTNLTTNPEETTNGSQKNFMLFDFLKVFGMVTEDGKANIDPMGILQQPMTWDIDVDAQDRNFVKARGFHKPL